MRTRADQERRARARIAAAQAEEQARAASTNAISGVTSGLERAADAIADALILRIDKAIHQRQHTVSETSNPSHTPNARIAEQGPWTVAGRLDAAKLVDKSYFEEVAAKGPAAVSQTNVLDTLEQQEKALASLHEELSVLEVRLSVVLTSEATTASGGGDEAVDARILPRLQRHNRVIDVARQRVQALLTRLQL